MSEDEIKAELATLVNEHLERSRPEDLALAAIATGLGRIGEAMADVAERLGTWGRIINGLRRGTDELRAGLQFAAQRGPRDAASLLGYAERQLPFGELLLAEVLRLQAGESTPV